MKPFLLFIFLVPILTVTGQTKQLSGDCITAVPIDVVQRVTYGPTRPPQDFGLIQEIKAGKSDSKTEFEQEHFTAWYLLNIRLDGELVFEIVPVDSSDDYDFLLYPCTDTLSCVRILQKTVLPIRGNLSRNTLKNKGRTGLLDSKAEAFYGKGVNPQFSRSLQVRKGEKYVLVLDNVYEHGKGHSLFFN